MRGKDERSLSTICAVLCVTHIVEAEDDVDHVEDGGLLDTLVLEVVALGGHGVNMKSDKNLDRSLSFEWSIEPYPDQPTSEGLIQTANQKLHSIHRA